MIYFLKIKLKVINLKKKSFRTLVKQSVPMRRICWCASQKVTGFLRCVRCCHFVNETLQESRWRSAYVDTGHVLRQGKQQIWPQQSQSRPLPPGKKWHSSNMQISCFQVTDAKKNSIKNQRNVRIQRKSHRWCSWVCWFRLYIFDF